VNGSVESHGSPGIILESYYVCVLSASVVVIAISVLPHPGSMVAGTASSRQPLLRGLASGSPAKRTRSIVRRRSPPRSLLDRTGFSLCLGAAREQKACGMNLGPAEDS